MPNETFFRINETLYIPVMVDRITQYSDAPTKYFVRLPAGIEYFLSDSPPTAIIKEDSLKDVALRNVQTS